MGYRLMLLAREADVSNARETLATQIREWKTRQARAKEEAAQAEVILTTLREALGRLGGQIPQPSTADAPVSAKRGPKGIRRPIQQLFEEFQLLTAAEVEHGLETRFGLSVSNVAIRYNLNEMEKRGEIPEEKAPPGSAARVAFRVVRQPTP